MPVILSPRRRRLIHFGSIYFAQGAILSYFLTFNILYLRQHGFAAAEIGFFQATLVLPFLMKLVFALISDRYSLFGLGHRFPYIVVGLTVQCMALLILPSLSLPQDVYLFFLTALCGALGMAMYDTCADGLAVEITPPEDRALLQGAMVGARAAGILCALLLGSYLAERFSWLALFVMIILMSLPALVVTLMLWERGREAASRLFSWSAFASLRRHDVLLLAAMGLIYALALDAVLSYLSYHDDAGGLADVGVVSGLVAISMVGRIAGALTSSRLTERLGYRRGMRLAIVMSALACLALSMTAGTLVLAAACLLFGFAYGYYTSVYSAAAMLSTDPRIAASMFAVFMIFLNIGVALGQAVGGLVTEAIGFQGLAWSMAAVSLVNLELVRRVRG
jgi:PAT family beta-lactamase induction signal transducer AmpG